MKNKQDTLMELLQNCNLDDLEEISSLMNNSETPEGIEAISEQISAFLQVQLQKVLENPEGILPYTIYKALISEDFLDECPKEIAKMIRETLTVERKHNYMLHILKTYIECYLYTNLYISCDELKQFILSDEDLDIY